MRSLLVAVALVLAGPGVAAAAAPAPYPAPATCVDTARVLGAATCARITRALAADEKASPERDEIAVAVVPTTGSASIETWSTGLFNEWGVGQAGTDNGVLLVVAVSDRALRIVTGDGLRTRLPDGRASEIIGSTITPLLRSGRTADAVLAGLDGIRTELGHDVSARPLARPGLDVDPVYSGGDDDEAETDSGSGSAALLWLLLLAGVGILAWMWSLAHPSDGDDDGSSSSYRRRSYSSRRSFSSGSRRSSSSSSRRSGFGGGRSSGGGASGRW